MPWTCEPLPGDLEIGARLPVRRDPRLAREVSRRSRRAASGSKLPSTASASSPPSFPLNAARACHSERASSGSAANSPGCTPLIVSSPEPSRPSCGRNAQRALGARARVRDLELRARARARLAADPGRRDRADDRARVSVVRNAAWRAAASSSSMRIFGAGRARLRAQRALAAAPPAMWSMTRRHSDSSRSRAAGSVTAGSTRSIRAISSRSRSSAASRGNTSSRAVAARKSPSPIETSCAERHGSGVPGELEPADRHGQARVFRRSRPRSAGGTARRRSRAWRPATRSHPPRARAPRPTGAGATSNAPVARSRLVDHAGNSPRRESSGPRCAGLTLRAGRAQRRRRRT